MIHHENKRYKKILNYLASHEPYSNSTFRIATFGLFAGDLLPGELAGKLKVSCTYGYLRRMEEKGLVERTGRGLWRLAKHLRKPESV